MPEIRVGGSRARELEDEGLPQARNSVIIFVIVSEKSQISLFVRVQGGSSGVSVRRVPSNHGVAVAAGTLSVELTQLGTQEKQANRAGFLHDEN